MKSIVKSTLILIVFLSLLCCFVSCDFSDDSEGSNVNPVPAPSNPGPDDGITFNGATVVDNSECVIKIIGIEPDNFLGYTLNVFLENKSPVKKYMFSVNDAYINGVKCDPFFAATVAAAKKANDSIHFSSTQFEENDIGKFTDIELVLRVYDYDDIMAGDVVNESVHIYPYGETKAVRYDRGIVNSDKTVINNDGFKFVVTGYEKNSIWGYEVKVYIENKTDKKIMVSVKDESVNGFMISSLFASTLAAGSMCFDTISWSDNSLEENGITSVNEIEFVLYAYDYNDIFSDKIVETKVTLNP